MPFAKHPRPESLRSIANVKLAPFWLDDPCRPHSAEVLTQNIATDLLIIGAGYTGLWTALLAKEEDPARAVVLVDAGEAGGAASGRNGGFIAASLTHGFSNGLQRWPHEIKTLTRMGHDNLAAIAAAVERYNIACDFLPSGEFVVAIEPYQVEELKSAVAQAQAYGERYEWLSADEMRAQVNSPLYQGALLNRGMAMANPAQLAWGLRCACLDLGVQLYEHTPVTRLVETENDLSAHTPHGQVRARRVALATNAFPPLLKRLAYYIVPVYDHALMTEPLSASQRASIGWQGRQGIGDAGNQFHYYRTTIDGRILWGGYDALYYFNNGFGPQHEYNQAAFGRLAEHFFETFPQLAGLRFTHAWGGAIDTCSRFSVFWGTAYGGRTAYSLGYTGLGVGAARFGAQVMLDLLAGKETDRTALEMVRTKPTPFPPEPLRSIGINLSRWSLDQADRNQGRRNLWLKAMDALGLGFDS